MSIKRRRPVSAVCFTDYCLSDRGEAKGAGGGGGTGGLGGGGEVEGG